MGRHGDLARPPRLSDDVGAPQCQLIESRVHRTSLRGKGKSHAALDFIDVLCVSEYGRHVPMILLWYSFYASSNRKFGEKKNYHVPGIDATCQNFDHGVLDVFAFASTCHGPKCLTVSKCLTR